MKKFSTVFLSAITFLVLMPVFSWAASFYYVDSNGMGVGNTSPQHALDISGAFYSRLVVASSTAINWNQGNVQSYTLAGNETLTFVNAQAGGEYKLIVNQDATGGRTITWPDSVVWAGGSAPTLTSDPSSTDVLSFLFNGSNYLGSASLNYVASSSPITLLTNLMAYWNLDESDGNAVDATGNGHTLTNVGTTTYTAGLINNSADFGSANTDKVLVQNSSNLGWNGTGPASVSFWVKVQSEPATDTYYGLAILSNDTNRAIYLNMQYANESGDKRLRFTRSDTGTFQDLDTYDVALGTSTWHQLVLTYDGTTAKGYLDGTEVLNFASTDAGNNSSIGSGFSLGDIPSGHPAIPASVSIDEVGVWNRVLSPTEITTLYNGGSGIQYPF